jgi:HlyD family secretion protein
MAVCRPVAIVQALAVIGAIAGSASCSAKADPGTLRMSGTIEAVTRDVSAQVAGVLVDRPIGRGESVTAGQVIGRIDPDTYRIRVREAAAALRQAEASLARSLRGSREEDVLAAAERSKEAEAEAGNAEAAFQRAQKLFDDKVLTPSELDEAHRNVGVARARLEAARQNYRKVAGSLPVEEIDLARAAVDQARAAADRARLDLARVTILAPSRGVATEVFRETGEYVVAGAPIVTIADLTDLYCWVYLAEQELGRVHLGAEVAVSIDAYPERRYRGTISHISPEAEFTPKSVQTREERVNLVFGVRVSVPNPDGTLKVGLPADVEVPIVFASPAQSR